MYAIYKDLKDFENIKNSFQNRSILLKSIAAPLNDKLRHILEPITKTNIDKIKSKTAFKP